MSASFGNPPVLISFLNTSTGALNYNWNFGDGTQSTQLNPSHTFQDTGAYAINLITTSAFGCTNSFTDSIFVLPRLLDVAVVDFTTTQQNNFVSVVAQLENKGTVNITSMDLYFRINDGGFIKETWTGNFPVNAAMVYSFNSQVFVDDAEHYVCVEAQGVNFLNDDVPSNNELCAPINSNTFQLMELYPNPASNSLTIPMYIAKGGDLEILVFDAEGKKVKLAYNAKIEKGMQFINVSVNDLSVGVYACKIMYEGKVYIKKFLKN
jgi:hypothetical protein